MSGIWRITAAMMMHLALDGLGEMNFQMVTLDDTYFAYERDAGDVNNDGMNDVVCVSENETAIRAFLAPNWTNTVLATPSGDYTWPRADDFKVNDLDGDGDADLVLRLGPAQNTEQPGIAAWFENQGSTGWVQRTIGGSSGYVKDICVADMDQDGRRDVIMRQDSSTQIYFQETNGWTTVNISHAAHEGMEVADLDMDGDPDIILNGFWFPTPDTPAAARIPANYNAVTIDAAWFNQGGDWTADSCKVVAGDFDGDGTNDVAFSHSERTGHAVAWYRSPTPSIAGTWVKHAVEVVDYCHNLQAADWDLDGDTDLLVGGMITSSQHKGLKLLLNGGDGTVWDPFVIQSDGSYSAEVGDIDEDGDLDIIGIRNWDSAPTYIYRNNAAGGPSLDFWFYKQVSAAHVRTFSLCFPDVDGDGDTDIASGPFVYINPGSPMTGTWTQVSLPGSVHAFATLDADSDSLADLIAQQDNSGASRIDLFWVEATNTSGTLWKTPVRIGDVPRGTEAEGFQGYRAAQLVAGGRPEILVNSPQGLYYFSVPAANPEAGNWPRTFIAANNSEEGVGVADLDGDGDLDISFTHGNPHEVKWARNPGDGGSNWDAFTIGTFSEAVWPDRCEAADLNGDGRTDIIVTEENFSGAPDALACWWEQPATGATNANWIRHAITTQYTMNSLDVGDVDQDGDIDLVLAEHRGTKRIAVWQNDGSGAFTEKPVGEGHESHLGGRLADLDGDGDLDLTSIAYDESTKLHVWRNDSPGGASMNAVRITEETDEGIDCYKIETGSATYYYDKAGGGFTSLLDKDGVDWITFHPQTGTGSAGEYRGIPNTDQFHPGLSGAITVTADPLGTSLPKVTLTSQKDGWTAQWEFFPSYAKMTLTNVPAGGTYWFLYEGTPGGAVDGTDRLYLSNGRDYSCNSDHPWNAGSAAPDDFEDISNTSGTATGMEWAFFAASEVSRSLFLAHTDDVIEDDYWQMNDEMSVFGFGRNDSSAPLMSRTNEMLIIGFVDSRNVNTVKSAIDTATRAPTVAAPVISPDGGVFDETLSVTLTCSTPDTEIWFTTSGADPTNQAPSLLYTNAPIAVTESVTLKARGFKTGFTPGSIATATFTGPKVKTPVITPSGGTFSATQSVTITCATTGTTIRYTLNGANPQETDTAYTSPLTLTHTATVKTRAFRSGLIASDTAQSTFTLFTVGAVAHWRLDERFGTMAMDSSGGAHHGAVAGAVQTAGHHDNALFFDGVNDRVECGTWDVSGTSITISAWIKLDPAFVDNDARIISKATGGQEQDHWWMLSTTTAGSERRLRVRLKAGGSTVTLIAGSGNLPLNTWIHAAASYDGSTLKLFKDGVEVGSTSKTGTLDTNPAVSIWIGDNPPSTYAPFKGQIDDVRIYNTAMNATDITAVMNDVPALYTPWLSMEPSGSAWSLTAAGQPGHTFYLQRTTNLLAPQWQNISTQTMTNASTASFIGTGSLQRAFFRLRID